MTERWLERRPIASEYIFTAFASRGERRLTARLMTTRALVHLVDQSAQTCHLAHVKLHDFRRFLGTTQGFSEPIAGELPSTRGSL